MYVRDESLGRFTRLMNADMLSGSGREPVQRSGAYGYCDKFTSSTAVRAAPAIYTVDPKRLTHINLFV